MRHIKTDRILEHHLGEVTLSDEEEGHLRACERCQQENLRIGQMIRNLEVAKISEPSSMMLEAYAAVFDEYSKSGRNTLDRILDWVSANLVLDSRLEATPLATRSVGANSYRLLYETPQAEIELFVEPDGMNRRLQGEVLPVEHEIGADDPKSATGILIQLLHTESLTGMHETETDALGRFTFGGIPSGVYNLTVTSAEEGTVEIRELQIT